MNAELDRGRGHNHITLTLDIDGLSRSIMFKSGANVNSPISVTAAPAGGVTSSALYDPWTIEGVVTVSKDLAKWMLNIYLRHNFSEKTSASLMVYSTTENLTIKHMFGNARVHRMPHISVGELGAEVTMDLAFSLNDWQGSEVQ